MLILLFAQQNNTTAGTVVTLTATYSATINGTPARFDGGPDVGVTAGGTVGRGVYKFDLSSIPATGLYKAEFIDEVSAIFGSPGADTYPVGPYNGDGSGNPQTDALATTFAAANVISDNYGVFIEFRTTGVKTIELLAPVLTDIAARAGLSFSLAKRVTDEVTTDHLSEEFGYLDSGHEPKLRITYIASGSGPISVGVRAAIALALATPSIIQAAADLATRAPWARAEVPPSQIQAAASMDVRAPRGYAQATSSQIQAAADLGVRAPIARATATPSQIQAAADLVVRAPWAFATAPPSQVQISMDLIVRAAIALALVTPSQIQAAADLATRAAIARATATPSQVQAAADLGTRAAIAYALATASQIQAAADLGTRAAIARAVATASQIQAAADLGTRAAIAQAVATSSQLAITADLITRAAIALGFVPASSVVAASVLDVRAAVARAMATSSDIQIQVLVPVRAPWAAGFAPASDLVYGSVVGARAAIARAASDRSDLQIPVVGDVRASVSRGLGTASQVLAGAVLAVQPTWAIGHADPSRIDLPIFVSVRVAWASGAVPSGFLDAPLLVGVRGAWASADVSALCLHVLRAPNLVDQVVPVLDEARQILEDLGLRPYRVFFLVDTWTGGRPGEGTLSRVATEIHPAPRVRGFSGSLEMTPAGQRLVGEVTLDRISRDLYTREQLKGLEPLLDGGGRRALNETFRIGLLARGQALLWPYVPGEPGLERFGWRLKLAPGGDPIPYTPAPLQSDLMQEIAVQVIDPARQILTELGLRHRRVFQIVETWTGARIGEGTVSYQYTELSPAPRVRFVSEQEEQHAAGRRLTGDAVLDRISRTFNREQLRMPRAATLNANERAHWGIEGRFQDDRMIELYQVSGEPILDKFGWSIDLRPEGRRIPPC